jgi:protein SCO1/2
MLHSGICIAITYFPMRDTADREKVAGLVYTSPVIKIAGVVCLFIVLSLSPPCYARVDQYDTNGGDWLNERLGVTIPGDIILHDESGTEVRLGDLINKPTVLTLVYYHCSHICPQMLFGLSGTLSRLDLVPGRDYKVITLSFDDSDTPLYARTQKTNYVKAIDKPFPEDSWRFLTGSRDNVEKVARAVGIKYEKVRHGFIHPAILIFVSPERRITRYLHVSTSFYGVQYPVIFSTVEFAGALSDASKGIVGGHIKRTPLLCFPDEPEQEDSFFHLLSILGAVTLLLLVALFVYLGVTSRKSSGGKG